MKVLKNTKLSVENYSLRRKLVRLEKQHKEDTELINYLSLQLFDELYYEIHNLKNNVDELL